MQVKNENKSDFQVVTDTNVILAWKKTKNEAISPNKEFIDRWTKREFDLLYSDDIRVEYAEKMLEEGIPEAEIIIFLADLKKVGKRVEIEHYYFPSHLLPEDPDDRPFILCADNGEATHLVSYDPHLLVLQGKFKFAILKTVPFLRELRAKLASASDKK